MPLQNSPNHFLSSLPTDEALLIEPHLRPSEFPSGKILYRAEDLIEDVYLPHTGIISLVVGLSRGLFVEAGVLGRSGSGFAAQKLNNCTSFSSFFFRSRRQSS